MTMKFKISFIHLAHIHLIASKEYGYRLQGSVIKAYHTAGMKWCANECVRTASCQSYNYKKEEFYCELNSKKKEDSPGDYIPDDGYFYDDSCGNEPPTEAVGETKCSGRNIEKCSSVTCPSNHKSVLINNGQIKCVKTGKSTGRAPASSTANPAELCSRNNDGYTYNESVHLCIKVHSVQTNWANARKICNDEEGDLLIVDTEEKYNFLTLYHESESLCYAWLGARDVEVEGQWKWIDDTVIDWQAINLARIVSLDDKTSGSVANADCLRIVCDQNTLKFFDCGCNVLNKVLCARKIV